MLSAAASAPVPSTPPISVQDLPILPTTEEAKPARAKRKLEVVDVVGESEEWRDEFAYADTLVDS
jgi:hypothetical protein